jgi:GH18 family chitinase
MASPEARTTFATNVAKFVKDEGIDGVDFDWEYPGVCRNLTHNNFIESN